MWGAIKPLANIKRTKVYGCYLIGLSSGELKKRKKTEQGTKVKSWSPTAPVANCSHCNLISMSKRIDTGSAISNRLFTMPKPGGELHVGPGRQVELSLTESPKKSPYVCVSRHLSPPDGACGIETCKGNK